MLPFIVNRRTRPSRNLQPIAVVLQLMHPTRANRGPLGNDRTAGMNETGRRLDRLPAGTTRHAGDINGRFFDLKFNIKFYVQRIMRPRNLIAASL